MENGRIPIPLLGGHYHPLWKIQSRAQVFFLDIVGRITPKPLYVLRDEVLPKYRDAFKFEREHHQPYDQVDRLSRFAVVDLVRGAELGVLPEEVQEANKAHSSLYDAGAALIDWCKEFNLLGKSTVSGDDHVEIEDGAFQQDHWPIVAALQTILFWHFHPIGWIWERRNPPSWCPPVLTLHEPTPEPEALPPIELRVSIQEPDSNISREIDAPGWYIGLETELQFRERMRDAFNLWLESYIARRERHARAAGLVRTPSKRKLTLHFTWAAKYQIDNVSPSRLAREYRVAKDTIEEGIQSALDLIHLARRSPNRGGLKGSRHSSVDQV